MAEPLEALDRVRVTAKGFRRRNIAIAAPRREVRMLPSGA